MTIVIKLGGDLVSSPSLGATLGDVAALVADGQRVILIHGGGPQTSAMQERLGQHPTKVGGRRVTDQATLDVLKMVVGGRLNIDLCAALLRAGGRPIGLHGASSCVIEAKKRPPKVILGGPAEPVDLGFVGDVIAVDIAMLERLLDGGHTPVLACIGASRAGDVFNINADVVAQRVAVELGADALVLASLGVPGVLTDRDDPATRLPRITEPLSRELVASGVIAGGMIPKVEEAFAAMAGGVTRVHIVGKLTEGDLRRELADPGSVGTALVV